MNQKQKHGMVMRYPATRWQDALPTGSGVVGAMVYGNIQRDTVLLNHDALYYPRGRLEALDVSDQLPEVRRLISEGKCREAAQMMPNAYAERKGSVVENTSTGRDPYQPFCSIVLQMSTDGPFSKYRRGVDFESGRAWVEWSDNTAAFTREVFVSRVTDDVFLRIRSKVSGAVSFRISMTKTRNEQADKELTHTNGLPGDIELAAATSASAEESTLLFTGTYPNGFSFGARGRLSASGGRVLAEDDALIVEGADEVVLKVRLWLAEENGERGGGIDFDAALAEHTVLHSKLFNSVTLALGDEGRLSNEEMLMAAYDGYVPVSLTQTMFDFGRYLLISASRAGGMPANLQGIWNGDYAPAWNSDIHTDENIQMNYWQAMQGGLGEVALPLFDYFEKFLDDFRENARMIFGCRGILIPIAMTTNGIDTPRSWSNWTAAAGWIAQHFYDYYLFTDDLEFLKERAVPWMKETALFYEDFLFEGDDGRLVFSPSISPENRPQNGNSLMTINATMDVAVCREVLANLCDACELLGVEEDGVARWRAMLKKLPDYEVNEDGAMKEWLHPAFEDNYHHRHQSHIYPVFPGFEVTEESNPEIYEACRVAVEKRLVIGLTSQTGWSMAHMANIYARLGQGDRALECMEILSRSSTGPNLLTCHNDWRIMGLSCGWGTQPPFQIDANFGIAAAVLEMLVFSKPGLMKLLPALPSKWRKGSVKGICCRGGITLNMEWDRSGAAFKAELFSKVDQRVVVRLPSWVERIKYEPEATVIPSAVYGADYWEVDLRKGAPLRIISK